MQHRFATADDANLLAPLTLNAELIRDEGHRNSMTVPELADRMSAWLQSEYQAVFFADAETIVGYVLFCRNPEYVYVRQPFIKPEFRRCGHAREAMT